MNPLKTFALLTSVLILLSGCTLLVNTAQSEKSRVVPVMPKTQTIHNVSQIQFDFSALKLSSEDQKTQQDSLYTMLVEKLKAAHLYQNDKTPAITVKIIVKRVNDNFSDKAMEAFVILQNNQGQTISSAVFVERGEGLRRLSYFKAQFIDQLVKYIQSPAQKVQNN